MSVLPHVDRSPRAAYPSPVSVESPVTEQAKGVLIMRYGINSYEALAVLARWSHQSGASIGELARALTHGVCQGRRSASRDDVALVRWIEQRLRADVSEEPAAAR
jgi:hypothetical protein